MSPAASIGLLYHRVATPVRDPFGIAVSPEHFAEHVEVLRPLRPLPLARFAALTADGVLPAGSVTVSFDDGYRDNIDHAVPVLAANDIPATIFVLAGTIGGDRAFWWDALAAVLERAPQGATIATAGHELVLPADRTAGILAIWARLRRRPDGEIRAAIDALHERFGGDWKPAAGAEAVDAATLASLAERAPVQIGSHTVTHPSLASHRAELQAEEIASGRAALERILDRPVTTFAYPFGRPRIDVTPATARIARQAGITAACTVDAREIRGRCDPLAIRRWMVPNVDGATFERMLYERLRGAGPIRRVAREARRALLDLRDR